MLLWHRLAGGDAKETVLLRAPKFVDSVTIENTGDAADDESDNAPYGEYGGWHKAAKADSPTVTTTLKNLCALSAEALESCGLRRPGKAVDVVRNTMVAQLMGSEAVAEGAQGDDGSSAVGPSDSAAAAEGWLATTAELPSGWKQVVSRSRPGTHCFENIFTRERQGRMPTGPGASCARPARTCSRLGGQRRQCCASARRGRCGSASCAQDRIRAAAGLADAPFSRLDTRARLAAL